MDTFNYIFFTNPVSAGIGNFVKKSTGLVLKPKYVSEVTSSTKVIQTEQILLHKLAQQCCANVRIGALFGASGIMLGAYGAHKTYPKGREDELKRVFDTANRYHLIHSLTLIATPLCRYPKLSGAFLSVGMIIFCGTCYHYAITGTNKFGKLTPIGGTCLIIGWLSMVL